MRAHFNATILVLLVAGVGVFLWGYMSSKPPELTTRAGVERLPGLSLKGIDGADIRTSEWAGKVVIVNFWASWCAPCIEEVPSLIKLSQSMGEKLRILAVSGDVSPADIEIFLKSFPGFRRDGIAIVFDEGMKIARTFDVTKLPESYIFDSSGRMVRKVVGTIDWSTKEAIEYLNAL